MKKGTIPDEVKKQVEAIVATFNKKKLREGECYYEVRFRGKRCYLDRCDHGRSGPICSLTYTGDMDKWGFAIFKWSSETYDRNEWMFPGSEHVDGTVEGALKAGLKAHPA